MARIGGSEGASGVHTKEFDEAGGYDASPVSGETVYTATGTIRDTRKKDPSAITDVTKKELSIQDEEAVRWIRNPAQWEGHEYANRFYDFQADHPGARIPTDKNGQPRCMGDVILATYPKADEEAREAEQASAREKYLEELNNHPDSFRRPRSTEEEREFAEHVEAQWQAYMDAGMIGPKSPTHGLAYNDARARYSEEQVQAEEARFRAGATHVDYDDAQWKADIDRFQARQNRTAGGRSHAFSGVGFAENKRPGSGQGRTTTRRE